MTQPSPDRPIVIGAGIIGASIAYHLARAGRPPLVLDAAAPGGVATAASWAWINASWGTPPDYVRLRLRSIALWRELATALPALDVNFCGSLTWDMSAAELSTYANTRNAPDYRVALLSSAELGVHEPRLRLLPERAAHCPDEATVEPVEAARILMAAAVGLGAAMRVGMVERIAHAKGRVMGVVVDSEVVQSDQVVCAAGVGARQLLADARSPLPIDDPVGLLVHTEPLPPVLNHLLIAPELHVRQTRAGRLVAGFDFSGAVLENPDADARRLIGQINAMLDLPEPARIAFTSLGRRPTPGDGFPLIGPAPGIDGLTVAVMHSGVTLAPVVGALLAAELTTGRPEPLLAPYRPARFATESAKLLTT